MQEIKSSRREPSIQLFSASRQARTNDGLEWPQHPSNPLNWHLRKKWTTMSVACWVTFVVGLNATSLTTASKALSSEFHLSNAIIEDTFLPSTAWNAAAAVVPMITLPLMDTYGVRIGYVVCPALFCNDKSSC